MRDLFIYDALLLLCFHDETYCSFCFGDSFVCDRDGKSRRKSVDLPDRDDDSDSDDDDDHDIDLGGRRKGTQQQQQGQQQGNQAGRTQQATQQQQRKPTPAFVDPCVTQSQLSLFLVQSFIHHFLHISVCRWAELDPHDNGTARLRPFKKGLNLNISKSGDD